MSAHAFSWLLGYLVNSLWQVALVTLAALPAARVAARLGPAVAHRVWAAALLVAAVLPALRIAGWGLPAARGSGVGVVRTSMGSAAAAGAHVLAFAPWLAAGLVTCWLVCTLYAAARLAWALAMVRRLRLNARLLSDAEAAALGYRCELARPGVQVRVVEGLAGPMVVGSRSPWLLLPDGFVETVAEQDRAAALAHELAHVRRGDYARNLLYSVAALPVAYHPGLWLLRARVTESREMACDALAGEALRDAKAYARCLLRLAEQRPRALHGAAGAAMGIFDGRSLERRITNMTQRKTQLRGMARAAAVGALTLFAAGAGVATAAMRVDVSAASAAKPITLQVKGSVMEGNIVSKVMPTYPAEAKKAHEQGTVAIAATIDRTGTPVNLHVVKSAGAALDASAMKAVRQWRWKPYLLNGSPVDVDTTVNVTYSLAK